MNNDKHKIGDILFVLGFCICVFVSLIVIPFLSTKLSNNTTAMPADKKELEAKQVNTEEIIGYVIDNNGYRNISLVNSSISPDSMENFDARITVCCIYTEGEKELYNCISIDVNDLTTYFDYMSTVYKPRTVYKETTVYEDNSETTVYRLGDLIE